MKTMGKLISYILVMHFALYPQSGVSAATSQPKAAEKKVTFSLVKILANELKMNSKDYFTAEELSKKESIMEKSVTNSALEEIKKKLRNESYSFSQIKQELQAQLLLEEQNKMVELKFILSKVSPEKLDAFFSQAMKDGYYSPDFKMSYFSAYNQREKIEVLMQMLSSDVSLIRSQNAKQLGLMTRADILKQLEATGTLMNYKNDKVIMILIIVLSVAAAGFITWGIISATKARHERKKKELNDEFDQAEQNAQNQYNADIATLDQVFAERARLREEGYVWQVCSTTTTVKTASCSYDYKTHAGEEVCVTHCLKQPQTGAEAMHSKTCLSSYIPNNCFQKNPTAAGYDDGYDDGYDSGYDVGYDRGYDSAYGGAYRTAYNNAYSSGYDSGYSAGFSSGYSNGVSDSPSDEGTMKSFKPKNLIDLLRGEDDDRAMGYKKGFQEGYTYALQLKVGISF